jgi:hypothetical protein
MATLTEKKIAAWSGKLLDMGRRNKLLNYKERKTSSVNFQHPDIDEIFKAIIDGGQFEFAYRGDKAEDALIDSIKDEKLIKSLKKKQILTTYNDYYVRRALYRLRSKTRSAMEEQGVNILYAAFGMLNWTDAAHDVYASPLITVPCKLTVDSLNAPYKLSLFEDEVTLNQTLIYKLKQSYNVTLPEYDEDKYLLIGDYLKAVADSVAERGWTVNKTAVLSLFSYNKLDMYTDLVLNKDKIAAHPVIRTLSGESILDGINSSELDMELDGVLKTGDSYCVADADSSQLNAVVQMKKGKSFVLQGPPGTGKSQTITNIIAEGLAAGKKVLFVSEKKPR